jgi:hypothetical protein
MTSTERAKEIRKVLKTKGWNSRKVSVRTRLGGYSAAIHVTIKALDISSDEVESLVERFERVRRCERSHEILAGGNTFVFVNYDRATEKARREGAINV